MAIPHGRVNRFGKFTNAVIHDAKLILCMPAKAGQSTIRATFLHLDYAYLLPVEIPAYLDAGYAMAAAFREPWARLCSGWNHHGRRRANTFSRFADWITRHETPRKINQHFRPQVHNWTPVDAKAPLPIDFVLRTETLNRDWAAVRTYASKQGVELLDAGHENRRKDEYSTERLLDKLSAKQIMKLRNFYADDFRFEASIGK